jgi:ribose transport system ATP-binding protein
LSVPALEMRSITKTYPGVRALSSVNLTVAPGEVHALLGENGAGKSTLMKILAGAQPMDSGEIHIRGSRVQINSPQASMSLGVSIIYQELNLVPELSVAENIYLGREPMSRVPGVIDYAAMRAGAQKQIARLGVDIDVRAKVATLAIAQQQMVEIAKAISRNASIIAMDEPSSTLTDHELARLFEMIRALKAEGVSIIYISHRLEEIFEIADRITVLRDGCGVGDCEVSEVDTDGLIRMMVGRELTATTPKGAAEQNIPALEVRNLNRAGVLQDINLKIYPGEILGLGGLVGAGRTELARAIFRADPIDTGEIYSDDKKLAMRAPQDAIHAGIGFVNEDRKAQGLLLELTVRENISIANLKRLSRFGFIKGLDEKRLTAEYINSLMIKTPSSEQEVKNLSGGNQQKVVLAKWLFTHSKILIFDEPTRGIDVGAKAEIHNLMNKLASEGCAILMISSEMPELLSMSDRILVMRAGRITGELSRAEATQESILRLAMFG